MKENKLRHYLLLIYIWLLIFPNIKLSAENTTTVIEGGYQAVYTNNGSEVIKFYCEPKSNDIKFVGKHSNSSSTISYWTMGYNISLEQAANGKISSLSDKKVRQIILSGRQKGVSGDGITLTTEYHLNYTTFVELLQSLLIQKYGTISKANEAMYNNGGVYVYFSNIFRVYKRPGGGVEFTPKDGDWLSGDIYDMNKMLSAQPWSQATLNYLPHYYNVKIKIELQNYSYDIVFVDKNKKELAKPAKNLPVYQFAGIEYTSPINENELVELGGKTYTFSGKSEYKYKDNTTSAVTKSGNTYAAVHQKQQNAVLYFYMTEVPPTQPTIVPPPPSNRTESITPITVEYMKPAPAGVIKADKRGSEQFDAAEGIPTTEKLYGFVKTEDYLIRAKFNQIKGEITYHIPVSKTYNLSWTATDPFSGEDKAVKISETVNRIVIIKRKYSFTSIAELAYYKPHSAKLSNYALPSGVLNMTPKNHVVPKLDYKVYGGTDSHIIEPNGVKEVVLPPENVSGGKSKPSYTVPDFTKEVNDKISKIKVKNDYMTFGGAVVLSDSQNEEAAPILAQASIKAPAATGDNVLYQNGLIIEDGKNNSTNASDGEVIYEQIAKLNTSLGNKLSFSIPGVNPVTIHTPVYCDGDLINDNKQYVQLINPDYGCVPIVLDTESRSNDFIVQISNYGYHSNKKGYGERDYKKYILRNEVIFPFDVYIDISNGTNAQRQRNNGTKPRLIENDNKDILLPANTWYPITGSQRFHVPMWVKEDIYTARYRSIAVNGSGKEESDQETANTADSKYAASDTTRVQISGKVYGLTLYDINDEVLWGQVFRKQGHLDLKKNLDGIDGTKKGLSYNKDYIYYYTVGGNNQYGTASGRDLKYTFPLIDGSHPQYSGNGCLKAGYKWNFMTQTTGNEMMHDLSYIEIKPRFYYVDKYGKGREEVDLYYSGVISGTYKNLVRVGSKIDLLNIRDSYAGSMLLSIPKEELKATAEIKNKDLISFISAKGYLHSYGMIKTSIVFKMYSNMAYAEAVKKRKGNPSASHSEIIRRKQSNYFTYAVPSSFRAVSKAFNIEPYLKKGIKYNEPFWKKGGYIIINFEITCYDKTGSPYLSYINNENYVNNGGCSMWAMEGAQRIKTDYSLVSFEFMAGDALMIYTDKTKADDFVSGGIY